MNLSYEEFLKLKRNIIKWYPFEENSSILEIWEGKEKEYDDKTQYDYVVIIGLGNKTIKELLNIAIKSKKPNGKILLAVDNKLGIKNLCTDSGKSRQTINKNALLSELDKFDLKYRKIYYPMPDYKATNVIFTDECLPNVETLGRDIILYDDNIEITLEEKKRIKALIEEDVNLFKEFANTFFVECSTTEFVDNNIKFVSYSNMRKAEYRIKTTIQGEKVYKTNDNEKSKEHIKNIKKNIDILNKNNLKTIDLYDEKSIISKYQNPELLLDKVLLGMLKNRQEAEALKIIKRFEIELIENLEQTQTNNHCFKKYNIEYSEDLIQNLHFVKYGLWDMIFQNCFYINNEFYFYDQEWIEENIPVEFIMYRAVIYFENLSKYIPKEEIFRELNIKKEYIDLFEKLDNKLQEQTRNNIIWDMHLKSNKNIGLQERINDLVRTNEAQKEIIKHKDYRIKDLETGMNEAIITIKNQETELRNIVNSVSWKITKPFRRVSLILHGNKAKKIDEQKTDYKKFKIQPKIGIIQMNSYSKEAINNMSDEYVAIVKTVEELKENWKYEIIKCINDNPNVEIIYSDEQKENSTYYKPDFSIDLLRSTNYIGSLIVVKKNLLESIDEFENNYDLILKLCEKTNKIAHISNVLYVSKENEIDINTEQDQKILEAHLKRENLNGRISNTEIPGIYEIEYEIQGEPKITILIPNKDEKETLQTCVESILAKTTYKNYEIAIIENNSTTQEIQDYYKELEKNSKIKILFFPEKEFNYSKIINFGVKNTDGDYVIQLNNDTEILTANWLEKMLGFCQRKDVGAVGARLYYPDMTLQHCGVVIGLGGVAGHKYLELPKDEHAYYNEEMKISDVSAVTGACLMTKREIYEEVGYMNEKLAVAFNDVDFCLKIREKGLLIVYNPFVELIHYESKSRGKENSPEKQIRFESEIAVFMNRWGKAVEKGDPYYNRNLINSPIVRNKIQSTT